MIRWYNNAIILPMSLKNFTVNMFFTVKIDESLSRLINGQEVLFVQLASVLLTISFISTFVH